jgi:GDPmannose 4,6-dehydratase
LTDVGFCICIVVSTGKTYSVRDLCEVVFTELGMDYRKFVVQDDKFKRPEELNYLCGDSTKARKILNWEPEYDFETMIKEMVNYWKNKT